MPRALLTGELGHVAERFVDLTGLVAGVGRLEPREQTPEGTQPADADRAGERRRGDRTLAGEDDRAEDQTKDDADRRTHAGPDDQVALEPRPGAVFVHRMSLRTSSSCACGPRPCLPCARRPCAARSCLPASRSRLTRSAARRASRRQERSRSAPPAPWTYPCPSAPRTACGS